MKTMTAKFAGVCQICDRAFPKGATIVYNGSAFHAECIAASNARIAREDSEQEEKMRQQAIDHKAGLLIKIHHNEAEIFVKYAPSYKMAKAAAFEYLRTMPEGAVILSKMREGKKYTGREVVHYSGYSNMGYHEGWAFRYRVPAEVA